MFLDYLKLVSEFAFDREAAIISPRSANAAPLKLSRALAANAVARGALVFHADAVSYVSALTNFSAANC